MNIAVKVKCKKKNISKKSNFRQNYDTDSTKKKYYYEAMREYEKRTGEPAYTQVSGGVSFKKYFEKHMTAQQQRDWLGPQRYKLYKDFKLPLDRFIPPYPNKRMTIIELKEADKASFAAAPASGKPKLTKDELHREHLEKRKKQLETPRRLSPGQAL